MKRHKRTLATGISEVDQVFIQQSDILVDDPLEDEPVNLCMDVYKEKIHSYGSLDKLKQRIVVGGYLHNKDLIGDAWSPTASRSTLKYFLSYDVENKARVHQLDFSGSFLQGKVKN